MTDFAKVINPGKIAIDGASYNVFCKIEYYDGKLSISGVEGPFKNGNCKGSCGQINMGYFHRKEEYNDDRYGDSLTKIYTYSDGWTEDLFQYFLNVWKEYHLNNLRPECEHQHELWTLHKKVKLHHYSIKTWVYLERKRIEKELSDAFSEKRTPKIYEEDRYILSLPLSFATGDKGRLEVPIRFYKLDKTEAKDISWIYEKDHPEGILSKPCPVCGYKYGTAWKKFEVPKHVIDFLLSLPHTEISPAWI